MAAEPECQRQKKDPEHQRIRTDPQDDPLVTHFV
jgi:hypothetical protein